MKRANLCKKKLLDLKIGYIGYTLQVFLGAASPSQKIGGSPNLTIFRTKTAITAILKKYFFYKKTFFISKFSIAKLSLICIVTDEIIKLPSNTN